MSISDTPLFLKQLPILPTPPFLWEKSDPPPPVSLIKVEGRPPTMNHESFLQIGTMIFDVDGQVFSKFPK